MNFLHVSAAIVWLGGVSFMLFALRPAAMDLPPPQRLPLMAQVLMRFFRLVWLCIGLLLATGLVMLLGVGMKQAPVGWHLMLGIGLLMFAVFGHLYFGPFRRLRAAVEAADWPHLINAARSSGISLGITTAPDTGTTTYSANDATVKK